MADKAKVTKAVRKALEGSAGNRLLEALGEHLYTRESLLAGAADYERVVDELTEKVMSSGRRVADVVEEWLSGPAPLTLTLDRGLVSRWLRVRDEMARLDCRDPDTYPSLKDILEEGIIRDLESYEDSYGLEVEEWAPTGGGPGEGARGALEGSPVARRPHGGPEGARRTGGKGRRSP